MHCASKAKVAQLTQQAIASNSRRHAPAHCVFSKIDLDRRLRIKSLLLSEPAGATAAYLATMTPAWQRPQELIPTSHPLEQGARTCRRHRTSKQSTWPEGTKLLQRPTTHYDIDSSRIYIPHRQAEGRHKMKHSAHSKNTPSSSSRKHHRTADVHSAKLPSVRSRKSVWLHCPKSDIFTHRLI